MQLIIPVPDIECKRKICSRSESLSELYQVLKGIRQCSIVRQGSFVRPQNTGNNLPRERGSYRVFGPMTRREQAVKLEQRHEAKGVRNFEGSN
jgi:hypothetical protein